MTALEVSINGKRVPVWSLREAQAAWTAYRDQNGISSDMKRHDGKIFQGKKLVARVSYNGRLWAPDGREITLPCDVAL